MASMSNLRHCDPNNTHFATLHNKQIPASPREILLYNNSENFEMEVDQIMETRRGNVCVIFLNYKFRKMRKFVNGNVKFACCKKSCKSVIHTTADHKNVIEVFNEHDHEAYSGEQLKIESFRSLVRKKAVEQVRSQPSAVVDQVLRSGEEADLDQEDYQKLKRSVYLQRRKKFPKLPTSLAEAQQTLWECQNTITTVGGEKFCYSDGDLSIFTNTDNLKLLCEATEVFGDGTFDYAPKFYTQLYTLHVFKHGYCMQVAYCFLPKKDIVNYNKMWAFLKKLCAELCGKEINIGTFVADFEQAAHASVRLHFPGCVLRCCRFHLGQSWFRFIQKNPFLRAEYMKEDSPTGRWLRTFFGLSLLDAAEVEDAFVTLLLQNPSDDQR